MSDRPNPKLMDHEYDGIQEYDNPTPGWWHLIFLASVVFSVVYFIFFEYSPMAWTIHEDWEDRRVARDRAIFGKLGDLQADEATLMKLKADASLMSVADGIFQSNCAACHAKDGGGGTGVNLTDDSYKNVKKIEDLFTVITKGAGAGAMPAWENRLSANQRVLMASYAARLRGTQPASPKAAEGEAIPAWPAPKGG